MTVILSAAQRFWLLGTVHWFAGQAEMKLWYVYQPFIDSVEKKHTGWMGPEGQDSQWTNCMLCQ